MKSIQDIPELENEIYRLKKIAYSEAESIIEISMYDGFQAKTKEDVYEILGKIENDITNEESLHWGIYLKPNGNLIGNIGFYRGFENNTGEIGYVLKEKYRRRGIMTEVVPLVVEYAFNELDLSAIVAYTDYNNTGSIKVLENNYFKSSDHDGKGLVFKLAKKKIHANA